MIHRGTGIYRGSRGVGSPAEVTGFIAIAGCRFRRYHRQKRSLSVSRRSKRSLHEFVPCQTGSHRGRKGVGSPVQVARLITIASCMIHRGTGIYRGRRDDGSPAEVTRLIVIAGCRFRRYHRWKRSLSVSLHEFVPCQTGSHRGRRGDGIHSLRKASPKVFNLPYRSVFTLKEFVLCRTGSLLVSPIAATAVENTTSWSRRTPF